MGAPRDKRRGALVLFALVACGCGDTVARAVGLLPAGQDGGSDTALDAKPPIEADTTGETGDDAPASEAALDAGPDTSFDAPPDVFYDVSPYDAPGGCTQEIEPNTNPANAETIGRGTTCGELRSPSDNDFYNFSFTTAGVQFTFEFNAQDDAVVVLIAPNDGGTQPAGGSVMINEPSQTGTYVVLVFSPTGTPQSYDLVPTY